MDCPFFIVNSKENKALQFERVKQLWKRENEMGTEMKEVGKRNLKKSEA